MSLTKEQQQLAESEIHSMAKEKGVALDYVRVKATGLGTIAISLKASYKIKLDYEPTHRIPLIK